MNLYISNQNLIIVFVVSVALLISCSKKKELEQLGCVKGKTQVGDKNTYTIGSMPKKIFLEYLNKPTTANNYGKIINSEMRWIPIKTEEECHIQLQ